MFVILTGAILGSAVTFFTFLPFGWGTGLLAAPAGGALIAVLAGIVIARRASAGRTISNTCREEHQPIGEAGFGH